MAGSGSHRHILNKHERRKLRRFRDPDAWSGSWYELALEFPAHTNGALVFRQVNQIIWQLPSLSGVVTSHANFGEPWQDAAQWADGRDLYGSVRLDANTLVACGSTWLSQSFILYIPVGVLELVYPVDYPLSPELNPWLPTLREALAFVGGNLYRHIKFALGGVGEEISNFISIEALTAAELATNKTLLAPEPLFDLFQVPPRTHPLSDGLWWTGD